MGGVHIRSYGKLNEAATAMKTAIKTAATVGLFVLILLPGCAQRQADETNLRLLYWNIQNGMWSGQGDNYTRFVDWVSTQNPDVCVWCEAVSNYRTASDEKIKPEEAYLPEHWDTAAYPENSVRYWDLSAWDPTSGEYQARREEIDFVRKHGRNAYDRIERLIAAGKRSDRRNTVLILAGCILWWLGCTLLHPFLRRKEGEYNFPTRASIAIRWLGILIPIAVLLVALLFEIRNFR